MAESAKNFHFRSPGIKTQEIDQSEIPNAAEALGPVIIGRAKRGPAFKPVKVNSFDEFVKIFGEPVAGGTSNDVWRDGNLTSPMYGVYGAQSWLKNGEALTYVRVLGDASPQATSAGKAGWTAGAIGTAKEAGGAYGLFVFPSSSAGNVATAHLTGALAAVFYMATGSGAPQLSGNIYAAPGPVGATTASNSILIESNNSGDFVIQFTGSNLPSSKTTFSMTKTKGNFIRKVFNTNPTLLGRNSETDGQVNYFLGETYEDTYKSAVSTGSYFTGSGTISSTKYVGVILGLMSGSSVANHSINQNRALQSSTLPKSGWFFTQHLSQDTGSFDPSSTTFFTDGTVKKLFRFVGLDTGEDLQNNFKVSIANIKPSSNEDVEPYGTFDVEVRRIHDTDENISMVERYVGCTLDVSAESYILNVIGDKYTEYDDTKARLIEKGSYPNKSKYIRVEINSEFESGFEPSYVPFGITGPTKYKNIDIDSDSALRDATTAWVTGGTSAVYGASADAIVTGSGADIPNLKIMFPEVPVRTSTSTLTNIRQGYWGAYLTPDGTDAFNNSVKDHIRCKPTNVANHDEDTSTVYQWVISLDNVKYDTAPAASAKGVGTLVYSNSARYDGYSLTATASLPTNYPDSSDALLSYKAPLALGVGNLTSVFYGGTNGFDITESDPLRNSKIATSPTLTTDPVYYSYRRAIDTVKHPEIAEYHLIAIPGMNNESLNKTLVNNSAERSDALAVIDIEESYLPPHERLYDSSDRNAAQMGDIQTALETFKSWKMNSSYGAAYYPWVQIRDSISEKSVWVPPSVAALGALAYTDKVGGQWQAPAGFNRAGLSSGEAGLPVSNVALKLFSSDRDDLYDININPIASFPNQGVVIWGQKTLQVKRSGLDRVNVRRLMLHLKRGISLIGDTVLFEPNLDDTWKNFKRQAEPFLAEIKAKFGLVDYKLVLDETTTTPDLVDQNIMYVQIWVKPAKSIEFIAVDFYLTTSGATFNG